MQPSQQLNPLTPCSLVRLAVRNTTRVPSVQYVSLRSSFNFTFHHRPQEQGLLRLRKEMQTFGNLRPCNFASPALADHSPLKRSICEGMEFMIVRELTGGIYFGERREGQPSDGDDESAEDRESYCRQEIERITRLAAHLALTKSPPSKVWSLDKANVLATSRLWRRVMTEVMQKEFPILEFEHKLIDSAAMVMVKNPRQLNGVLVTSNLFGDIISDEAAAIVGSLGLLPSASLSGIPKSSTSSDALSAGSSLCNGLYEPAHGSAPDIAGKDVVNPVAAILTVAMMLQYSLNMPKASVLVEQAVRITIEKGIVSRDLGGMSSTKEIGDAVVKELENLMS